MTPPFDANVYWTASLFSAGAGMFNRTAQLFIHITQNMLSATTIALIYGEYS